jgi:rubredoxin
MGRPTPVQNSQVCPHCGTPVGQPEWSENVGDQEVVSIWRCAGCGNQFETQSSGTHHEPSPAELAEEFLPRLVVE